MHLHIDTDMGVDDGLALTIAATIKQVSIEAVSAVFGNVGLDTAVRNAFLFRSLLNARWPILRGSAAPRAGTARNAIAVHKDDGLGGATQDPEFAVLAASAGRCAAADLAQFRPAPEGKVVILGLGPATNIPELIALYGRERVLGIVLMSGVFFDVGNVGEDAEFNAACDPHALREVIGSGLPVTFVPLDVCRKILLDRGTVQNYAAAGGSPAAQFVARSHMAYMDHYRQWESIDGCFPHDSIALLAAIYPEHFFRLHGRVAVAEGGTTRLAIEAQGPVSVVTGGNLAWVRRYLQQLDFTSPDQGRDRRSSA